MNIFFDTEFIDKGNTVHLLSIGMVREDGATYYAEDAETDRDLACDWVKAKVIPYLKGPQKTRQQLKEEIRAFAGYKPMFWGYFASYDWLLLCSLFGRMIDVPDHWPNHPMCVQQLRVLMNVKDLPKQESMQHHALNDAIWTKEAFEYLMEQK